MSAVLKKSSPGKFAYTCHFQQIGINATKIEKTGIHFKTDVFAAVAVVDAKAPYYGAYPGTYDGGKGAFKKEIFRLNKGTVLNIVVGQRGGNSVEVKGGQSTSKTAPELGTMLGRGRGKKFCLYISQFTFVSCWRGKG